MRCGGLAKGKPRRECCCTLVPKDPEQQPMVRSSLRDGPGDPSCLRNHQLEVGKQPTT